MIAKKKETPIPEEDTMNAIHIAILAPRLYSHNAYSRVARYAVNHLSVICGVTLVLEWLTISNRYGYSCEGEYCYQGRFATGHNEHEL